jgi:hypothetical protein
MARTTNTLKLNVWQVQELARLMSAHDDATQDPNNLGSAYADITSTEVDGEWLIVVRWENGGRAVIWHDGTDLTDEYPPEATGEPEVVRPEAR